jgi:hypothetical protein
MPRKELYPPNEDTRNPDAQPQLTYFFPEADEEPESSNFPWLRSDYDDKVEDQLCRICCQINYKYLFSNKSPYDLRLGLYGDVKLRDCSFCRLVVEGPRFGIKLLQKRGIFDTDQVVVSSGLNHPRSNWSESGIRDFLGFLVLQVWILRRLRPGAYGFGVSFSVIHAIKDHRKSINLPLSGRLISSQYDPEIILAWVGDCKTFARQKTPAKLDALNHIERFIDTHDERLIEMGDIANGKIRNSAQDFNFAAHSYVWGKAGQQLTLTKTTFQGLHQNGAISTTTDTKTSKTIRDAMLLCRDIGIRYLWVDALCIVQDDPDKLLQIKNLHYVYLNAFLTIVAGFGDNADAGLPGSSTSTLSTRQVVLKISEPATDQGKFGLG